jgi:DNA-binding transcriptional ArsR family regulator
MSNLLIVRVPMSKRAEAVAACCPACGAVQFQRAPDLARVYKDLLAHGPSTTSEIADRTGLTVSNTSQKLRHLRETLGIVRYVSSTPLKEGGKANTYEAIVRKRRGAKRLRKAAV